MTEQENQGFFQDLWDRRFFQFMGTYLGVGFGLVQFAQFIEERYNLGNWLVEKLLLFLVVMLPAMAVFIYNHGKKGSDKWKPFEKVFIPFSIAVASVSALFFFNEAQSLTQEVSITTEDGDTLTRQIPTARYTKRLVIFPFTNTTGNPANDWMEVATSLLLDKDLEQDMRIIVTQSLSMKSKYTSYRFDFLEPLPYAIKLKIAQDYYSDYFVDGVLKESAEGLMLEVKVVGTNDGEVFYENTLNGTDIYTLVDAFTADFTDNLYVKDAKGAQTYIDLPSRDLITRSEEALKDYVQAAIIRADDVSRLPEAMASLSRSLELDARCAECNLLQASLHLGTGNEVAANQSAETALSLADGLPERQQLQIRYINYMVHEELQKAISLLENWRTLYPSDLKPYSNLIDLYKMRAEIDKAKEVGRSALDNGHRGSFLIDLARLYIDTEDFDQAEAYIRQFETLYPHKAQELSLLGDIYVARGQLDKAAEFYERMVIFDPEDVGNQVQLAKVKDQQGHFTDAETALLDALAGARQISDSIRTYEAMEEHYIRLGQFTRSFEILEKRKMLMRKMSPEIVVLQQTTMTTWPRYLVNGMDDTYHQLFNEFKAALPERGELIGCVQQFLFYMGKENLEGMQQLPQPCVQIVIQTSGEAFELLYQAIIKRLSGEYMEAANLYEAYADSTGLSDKNLSADLSESYRKSGQLDKAAELMDRLLKSDPYQAVFLLERSRVARDDEEWEAARNYLDTALEVWENADSTYIFYQEALALQEELDALPK